MESIIVSVRFRPLSEQEQQAQYDLVKANQAKFKGSFCTDIWKVLPQPHNTIINTKTKQTFTYDNVFDKDNQNQEVFDSVAKPLVHSALNGINVTIFAYGQTSSGKTFTMRGKKSSPGLIPLTIKELFDTIQTYQNREYLLKVSYLEVYNEMVNDLLDPSKVNLEIRESLEKGIYVDKLTEVEVSCQQDAYTHLISGESNRKFGETSMNAQSSRSHTVFRVTIESCASDNSSSAVVSQLNLVDLAGSEGVQKTKAEDLRMREGSSINKSLLSLSTVIQRLSEAASKGVKPFVNYRNSKMTRLLQPSLSGNSRTSIICNVTPALTHFQETNNTLQFGAKAKRIKTNAKVNEILNNESSLKTAQEELKRLQMQIETLSGQLQDKENEISRLRQSENEKDSYYHEVLEKLESENSELKQTLLENEKRINEISGKIIHSRSSMSQMHTPASNEERKRGVQSSLMKSRYRYSEFPDTSHYIEAVESLVMEKDQELETLKQEIQRQKVLYEEKFQQSVMETEMLGHLESSKNEIAAENEDLKQQIEQMKAETENYFYQAQEEKANWQVEFDKLTAQVQTLQSTLKEYEEQNTALVFDQIINEKEQALQAYKRLESELQEKNRQNEWQQTNLESLFKQVEEQYITNSEQSEQIQELHKLLEAHQNTQQNYQEIQKMLQTAVSEAETSKKELTETQEEFQAMQTHYEQQEYSMKHTISKLENSKEKLTKKLYLATKDQEHLQDQLNTLKKTLETLEFTKEDLESTVRELKEKNQSLETDLKQNISYFNELADMCESLNKKAQEDQELLDSYKTQLQAKQETEQELDKATEEKLLIEQELLDYKYKNQNLKDKLQTANQTIEESEEIQKAYEQLEQENVQLTTKIENFEKQTQENKLKLEKMLNDYLEKNSCLNQQLIEKDNEISNLKSEIYQLKETSILESDPKELQELNQKLLDKEQECQSLLRQINYKRMRSDLLDEEMVKEISQSERHELVSKITESEHEHKKTQEELSKLQKTYEDLKLDNDLKKHTIKSLANQKRDLEKRVKELEEDLSDLRIELREAHSETKENNPVIPRKGQKKQGYLPSEIKNSKRKFKNHFSPAPSSQCESQ